METEPLSRYESNRDSDLMEGNTDNGNFEGSADADIQQNKEEEARSGDKETNDCDEQPCTTDKELNLETESKKDFTTYESDVEEEEEEDIPLNINADKSDEDSDAADENLEDSDRDENEDTEKEEVSEDAVADNTERQPQDTIDVDKDKPSSIDVDVSYESRKVSDETVLVSDSETDDVEKPKAGTSDTEVCGETEQSSEDILSESVESQEVIELKKSGNTVLLSDDESGENKKCTKETNDTKDIVACERSEQAGDVSDKSESIVDKDNEDAVSTESEKEENEPKGDVLDESKSVTCKDDDVPSNESETKVAETPTEDTVDDDDDQSERIANDNNDSEPQSLEKLENETTESMETTEKHDNPPEENVQSQKGDSEPDDTETSKKELLEDKPVEAAKGNDENCTKIAENDSENDIIMVDKSNEALANDDKSDVMEIMDLTNDEDNKPKGTVPVKKKRRRRQMKNQNNPKSKGKVTVDRDPLEIVPDEDFSKSFNEGEAEVDLDEDFDPSLFCPDINMEIEEAPVITNSDLPPVSADGSKSPALLDAVFSTYVDEVTGAEVDFNLTPEEEALRRQTFGEKNPIQFTRVHCTACNMHLGSALDGQGNRFVHPLLKVLICKNCYHFYTSGEFEKDEDGSELYCRWCGQGGQVMCCSNCEMVFCKKCIRINFDKKKMAEIRDSEDWVCFRCNPSQLIPQRIHCAEFMEYVRTETMRASTLENSTQFMTTDHTQCCNTLKRKATDPAPGEVKKRKRKPKEDPDYDPLADRASPVPSTSAAVLSKLVPIVPKPMDTNKSPATVKVASPNTPFKIGATTFRPQIIGNIRPRGPYMPSVPNQATGQNSPRQMYKLIPNVNVMRAPTPRVGFAAARQPTPSTTTGPAQTHEWFEKTVVATARVNSNLSYTLSQLNQTQAKATTVQALAVVHNKLQEILSNSINALIQIRKNLRVEFIAGVCTENPAPDVPPMATSKQGVNEKPSTSEKGIRNTRFPAQGTPSTLPKVPMSSKPVAAVTVPAAQDDDVILVTPASEPIPAPLQKPKKQIPIKLPASVSLYKKSPAKVATVATPEKATPGPSSTTGTPFLRVKPLKALQSVPSECITIPDDDIKPLVKVVFKPEAQPVKKIAPVQPTPVVVVNGTGVEEKVEKVDTDTTAEIDHGEIQIEQIDLKKPLSSKVKQMMEVKVVVPKLSIMEEKIQNELKNIANEDKNTVNTE